MREFDYNKLKNMKLSPDIIFLLGRIHEYKGKQDYFLEQEPNKLERLIEIAKIQSTQASNDIEGIRTTSTRLKQLLHEKVLPKNRNEEEIAGYKDVLNIIHENYEYIPLNVNHILQMHKVLFSHTGLEIGGKFKNVQNYISVIDDKGKNYTLFTPLAPYETKDAMIKICDEFRKELERNEVDPLILIAVFIHDFLCIHPFLDGNGRMSRLLTTLLLYKCGYLVGRYVSLESKIAKSKQNYYDALEMSQNDWENGIDDPTPFIEYLLGTIISAYRDFEERIEVISNKKDALSTVRHVLQSSIGKFTKATIMEKCPNLSVKVIEKQLTKLVESGEIIKHAAGRATFYTKKE